MNIGRGDDVVLLGYTFRTAGVRELGPLDEKVATRGDIHLPMTVFGELSFAVGDLHNRVDKQKKVCVNNSMDGHVICEEPFFCLPCSSYVGKYLCPYFIIHFNTWNIT